MTLAFPGAWVPASLFGACMNSTALNDASSQHLDTFLKHRDALVTYATPLVGDRMRAEDVVQEAWLRFSAALDKDRGDADPIAQPVGYLYRIVRNLSIKLARKLGAEASHPSSERLLNDMPADIADPERAAVDRDQVQALAAALDELPGRTRRAFDLHRFEDKTFAEIGVILNISQTRAHALVQEAVAHCTRRLTRDAKK